LHIDFPDKENWRMHLISGNQTKLRGFFPDYTWNFVADSILEGCMGKILADNPDSPSTLILTIPQHKLFIVGGEADTSSAHMFLSTLPNFSTIIPGKQAWVQVLNELHKGKIFPKKRYAYESDQLQEARLEAIIAELPQGFTLEQIDTARARQIMQEHSDLTEDQFFGFKTPDDFMRRGFGFCAMDGNRIVCIAATGAVCSNGMEIQINTHKRFRGLGLATATGAALILESLQRNIAPNWDAATKKSAGLAQKLGYVPKGTYYTYLYTGSRFWIGLRNFLRRVRGKKGD